jgi:hypothetical protein
MRARGAPTEPVGDLQAPDFAFDTRPGGRASVEVSRGDPGSEHVPTTNGRYSAGQGGFLRPPRLLLGGAHRSARPLVRDLSGQGSAGPRFPDFLGGAFEGRGRMRKEDPWTLRARLLAVHGIGREMADSIVYAAGLPLFVVDAYTRRIFSRPLVDSGLGYDISASSWRASARCGALQRLPRPARPIGQGRLPAPSALRGVPSRHVLPEARRRMSWRPRS